MKEYYKKEIEKNQKEIAKVDESWDYNRDYFEYERVLEKYHNRINECQAELCLLETPILSISHTKGNVMTLKDFIECVNDGGFIDYDGFGHYYSDGKVTDLVIYPSYVKMGKYRKDFNEIMWYNK